MKIAIDIMGGDNAPVETIKGAIVASTLLKENEKLVLIGDEKIIKNHLENTEACLSKIEIVNSTEVIEMDDHPVNAFKNKVDSSIVKGFVLLKSKQIDGFCSAGNTGAMLIGAMQIIKQIEGVIRPCIYSIIPKMNGEEAIILDVGLNPDCKPDVLLQYGEIGNIVYKFFYQKDSPRVALLNIGEEESKGNILTKTTHELMKNAKNFNFVGNVESREIYEDKADVVICDGFTGNIVLKQAEAVYNLTKFRNIKDDFFERFNFENYGGAAVLGINSTVVIGHGRSKYLAIKNMINYTKNFVNTHITQEIIKHFN